MLEIVVRASRLHIHNHPPAPDFEFRISDFPTIQPADRFEFLVFSFESPSTHLMHAGRVRYKDYVGHLTEIWGVGVSLSH